MNDDDDAKQVCARQRVHDGVKTDGFQDAKVMSEHEVDINASTIIGTGQNMKTKVVKQVPSWRPSCEQSRAAELATNTDATTMTMRNTTDEFFWERANARSVDGVTEGTATKRIALDYEALIERLIFETVDVNTIDTVLNSADKKLSSSEERLDTSRPGIEADIGHES